MHALDISEIVIQTDWCDAYEVFVQANSSGDTATEYQSSKSQLGKLPIEFAE